MPDPMTIAALASAGGSLLGGLFGGDDDVPEPPDVVSPAVGEVRNQRRELSERLNEQEDRVQADLAAAGITGSGAASARQDVFSEGASAQAEMSAKAADIVQDAINKQKMMDFQARQRQAQLDRQQRRNRIEGITSAAGNVATFAMGGGFGSGGGSTPEMPDTSDIGFSASNLESPELPEVEPISSEDLDLDF